VCGQVNCYKARARAHTRERIAPARRAAEKHTSWWAARRVEACARGRKRRQSAGCASVSPRRSSRANSRARMPRARQATSRDTPGGRAWDRAGARKRSCECVGAAAAARGGGGGWRPRAWGAAENWRRARAQQRGSWENTPSGAWKPIATTEKGALLREGARVYTEQRQAEKRAQTKACAKIEASPADAARTPRARMLSPSRAQRTGHARRIFWYPVNEHALGFIAMGLPSHDILNWLRYERKYARHDFFHYFFAYIMGLRHKLRALGSGAAVPVDVHMTCMHGVA